MSSNKECSELYFFHSRSVHAWLLGGKKLNDNLQKEYHLCNTVGLQVWVSYQQHHQQNLRNLLEIQNLRSSPKGNHIGNKESSNLCCNKPSRGHYGILKKATDSSEKSVTEGGPYAFKQSLIPGLCFPAHYPVSLSWGVPP